MGTAFLLGLLCAGVLANSELPSTPSPPASTVSTESTTTATTGSGLNLATNGPSFYSPECVADMYTPQMATFASIWALLNFILVIISSCIYLMYTCFNKFVNAMITG